MTGTVARDKEGVLLPSLAWAWDDEWHIDTVFRGAQVCTVLYCTVLYCTVLYRVPRRAARDGRLDLRRGLPRRVPPQEGVHLLRQEEEVDPPQEVLLKAIMSKTESQTIFLYSVL